jgi:hypothetical protein
MLPVILAGAATAAWWAWDAYQFATEPPPPPMPPAPRVPAGGDRGAVTRPDAVDEVIESTAAAWKQANEDFFTAEAARNELPPDPPADAVPWALIVIGGLLLVKVVR